MSNEPNNDRRQVADVVAERIERLIVDGVLSRPGAALRAPPVRKAGISRSALREGLRVLRGRGIIETSQGRGSFVAELSGNHDASPLMHLFNSQPRTSTTCWKCARCWKANRHGSPHCAAPTRISSCCVGATRRCSPPTPASRVPTRVNTRAWTMPSTGHLRGLAQPGTGAYAAVADRPDAQHRVRLGEQPLSPAGAETADRPPALAALPRGDRTPARAGPACARDHIHGIRDNLKEIEQENSAWCAPPCAGRLDLTPASRPRRYRPRRHGSHAPPGSQAHARLAAFRMPERRVPEFQTG